ncbi:Gfo/Idh/MocA family protein [Engelhardtia mirabilis]|uniref:Inositol 2-dehydrogenase n=1 Tax=Engelhardtia mirabilis TaxID=2528011 RepID=A0A518BHH1_9BACT|nr:Inositol 2-dehydrogenase [Planctomycetes bacterium Pla133]QDV00757.1 Inositol 2-dehydrogenase [Planctomycetes bacterium Pla86]
MTHRKPTRRDFLSTTAAAAGLVGLAGTAKSTVLQGAKRPVAKGKSFTQVPQDQPIRMAVIGTGGMGGAHLDAFLGFRERGEELVDIVALADVCKPRLDGAHAKCSSRQEGVEVTAHRDYREIIGRDDIHAVLIASPEHWHAQHAVDCVMAGKDVYVEKPMCLRLDDALWLDRVVQANDQVVQVGTQYMMDPKYVEARKLIKEGAIGKPTLSQTSYCRNTPSGEWNYYGIDPQVQPGEMLDWKAWCGPLGEHEFDTKIYHRWRRYRDFSTGILGDLLVHQMTPLIYSLDLGFPIRVTGSGGHYIDKDMENHDQVFLTVEFEGDHTMVVAGSTINDRGLEVMIRGHRGDLLLGGRNVELVPQAPYVDDVDPRTIATEGGNTHDALRRDWLGSVRSREENRSTTAFALKHMVVVELGTRSLWERKAFAYDPAEAVVTAI